MSNYDFLEWGNPPPPPTKKKEGKGNWFYVLQNEEPLKGSWDSWHLSLIMQCSMTLWKKEKRQTCWILIVTYFCSNCTFKASLWQQVAEGVSHRWDHYVIGWEMERFNCKNSLSWVIKESQDKEAFIHFYALLTTIINLAVRKLLSALSKGHLFFLCIYIYIPFRGSFLLQLLIEEKQWLVHHLHRGCHAVIRSRSARRRKAASILGLSIINLHFQFPP